MIDSLEVKVLYPAWWWRRISEAQGRRREAGSEGSGSPFKVYERARGQMAGRPACDVLNVEVTYLASLNAEWQREAKGAKRYALRGTDPNFALWQVETARGRPDGCSGCAISWESIY
jgi:hypothetical protein